MNYVWPGQFGNRREFFRSAGRYGFAGVIVGLVAVGVVKPHGKGEKCTNRGICNACGVFASCGLPAALSTKAFRQKNGGTA